MSTQKIFISHIEEEKAIALALKKWIKNIFVDRFEYYVFSDPSDIDFGSGGWLQGLQEAVKDTDIMVLLVSPDSKISPWIHFEAGYGWTKEIMVVTVCHSMPIDDLSSPLAIFRATNLDHPEFIDVFFEALAKKIGMSQAPVVPKNDFYTDVWQAFRPSQPSPVVIAANRSCLMKMAKRRYESLIKLDRQEFSEPADNISDIDLQTYGMVRIPNSHVLADPFPVSEMDFVDYCIETHKPLPGYLSADSARSDYPVVQINAFDAEAYASWIGKRLPTRREWESLAFLRPDGVYQKYPWGDDFSHDKCNTEVSKIKELTPFTRYPEGKSLSQAYDMAGNSWDWLMNAVDKERLIIGGSFYDSPKYIRRGMAIRWEPSASANDIGFRCVKDLD